MNRKKKKKRGLEHNPSSIYWKKENPTPSDEHTLDLIKPIKKARKERGGEKKENSHSILPESEQKIQKIKLKTLDTDNQKGLQSAVKALNKRAPTERTAKL